MKQIFELGVHSDLSLSEVKRVKLLNQMVFVFALFASIKLCIEISNFDKIGSLLSFSILIVFLLAFLFHKLGYLILARFHFILINISISLGLLLLFGREFGAEFALFPTILTVVVFFQLFKPRVLWFLFIVICYILTQYYVSNYGAIIPEEVSSSSFYFMLGSCACNVFLITLFFTQENRLFETRTSELLVELQHKNDHLNVANKELERFAYAASHDLKTPLRNISNFIGLAKIKLRRNELEEIPQFLEIAEQNSKRMHSLVGDILEFSKLNTNKASFKETDLNKTLNIVLANIQNLVVEHKARLEIQNLPVLFCNESQMISLFQNLIENGIKYNESEEPLITVTCEEAPYFYKLFVSDNGIGIDDQYQSKVFDMFYRLHNEAQYKGTGIGLASCRKIAMFHNGEITFDSIVGKGTTFCFRIPKNLKELTNESILTKELKNN